MSDEAEGEPPSEGIRGPSGHGTFDSDADAARGPLDPEGAWERAAKEGIHRLRIPTPFAVGRVNTYLIEDEPLTLIDSGPNSAKALDELETQLAARGRSIEEIELLVLTHQHLDHTGLAKIIARRSGAEVAAIDILAPHLASYSSDAEAEDEFAAELMRRHGVTDDVATALRSVSSNFRAWGSAVEVTRRLRDGERLELGERELTVQLRPGHSPSDTLFWDEQRGILVGGDHLLAQISSNPLLSRPLDGTDSEAGSRRSALLSYIDSMRLTRELDAGIILPGHGEPITDHVGLIDSRMVMHERRARKLLRLLNDYGPMSAHQIARRLWGDVAISQAFLTLSEVIGHLDVLAQRELVREVDGEPVHFEAVGARAGR